MNRALLATLGALVVILVFVEWRWGGILHMVHMNSKRARDLAICENIKNHLNADSDLRYVRVHLGKPPTDIVVAGFVPDEEGVNRVLKVIEPFRATREINVNVRVDPATTNSTGLQR